MIYVCVCMIMAQERGMGDIPLLSRWARLLCYGGHAIALDLNTASYTWAMRHLLHKWSLNGLIGRSRSCDCSVPLLYNPSPPLSERQSLERICIFVVCFASLLYMQSQMSPGSSNPSVIEKQEPLDLKLVCLHVIDELFVEVRGYHGPLSWQSHENVCYVTISEEVHEQGVVQK